jgi:hypothetical protein
MSSVCGMHDTRATEQIIKQSFPTRRPSKLPLQVRAMRTAQVELKANCERCEQRTEPLKPTRLLYPRPESGTSREVDTSLVEADRAPRVRAKIAEQYPGEGSNGWELAAVNAASIGPPAVLCGTTPGHSCHRKPTGPRPSGGAASLGNLRDTNDWSHTSTVQKPSKTTQHRIHHSESAGFTSENSSSAPATSSRGLPERNSRGLEP